MIIEDNKVVGIEYEMTNPETKEVLDSNKGMEPLEFIVGKGHIVPGLESKLNGMKQGETADIIVSPEEGYGVYNEEMIQTIPAEQFAGIELKEGMALYGQGEGGETVQVTVKSFNDTDVTIDYNHPMAGQTMLFSVMVTEVRDATADEVLSGQVGGAAEGESCGTGCGCH